MDESLKHKIFTETDCLSEQMLFDYIDKKLSARENHAVERHLLHCELCSDALEGLGLVKDRSRIGAINQTIIARISPPLKEVKIVPFNYKIILSVAATLLLLMGGVFFFNMLNRKSEMAVLQTDQSATAEPSVSEPPPPPASGLISHESAGSAGSESSEEKTGTVEEIPDEEDVKLPHQQEPAKEEAKKTVNPKYEAAADGGIYDGNTELLKNNVSTVTTVSPVPSESPTATSEAEFFGEKINTAVKDTDNESVKKQEIILGGAAKNDKAAAAYSYKEAEPKRQETKPPGVATDRDGMDNVYLTTVSKETNKNREAAEKKKKANDIKKTEEKSENVAYAPEQINTRDDFIAPAKAASETADEIDPEYTGGNDSIMNFIRKNYDSQLLTKYPLIAKQAAEVKFTVDKKGKVKNPVITKGLNTEMNKELLRVLKLMPPWEPAMIDGEAVSKEINLPVLLSK